MGKVLVSIRLDEDMYNQLMELSQLTGRSLSDVIRFHIAFAMLLLGPNTTLRDIIRDDYLERLLNNPSSIIDVALIDLIKPYHIIKSLTAGRED